MHNFDVVYYFDILYRVVVCEFGFTHRLCLDPSQYVFVVIRSYANIQGASEFTY